jgi:hypothetical protein
LFAKTRHSLRLTARIFDMRTFPLATLISLPGWLAESLALAWLMATLGCLIGAKAAMFFFLFHVGGGRVHVARGLAGWRP